MLYSRSVASLFSLRMCQFRVHSDNHDLKLTKIDDTRTWSEFHYVKVIYKISAQYLKEWKKTVQYSKFQKGQNSYKCTQVSQMVHTTLAVKILKGYYI